MRPSGRAPSEIRKQRDGLMRDIMRPSGRAPSEMRKVSFEPGYSRQAEGSCFVRFGDIHVLCTATLEQSVPPFLRGGGQTGRAHPGNSAPY